MKLGLLSDLAQKDKPIKENVNKEDREEYSLHKMYKRWKTKREKTEEKWSEMK